MTKHCLVCVFLALALASFVLSAEIRPRFGEATLRSETTEFRKIRVQSPWQEQHQAGGRRLAIDGNSVIERSLDNDREVRRIRSPEGVKLLWLMATDQVACFAIDDPSEGRFVCGYRIPPVIERLDLKTMQWLPSLRIEAIKQAEEVAKDQGMGTTKKPRRQPRDSRKQTVLSVGVAWRQTVVLLLYETRIRENSVAVDAEVDGCQVICLEPQSGKTKWNTFIAWEGNETLPDEVLGTPIGHFILRERRPPLQNHIQLLSIWDDNKSRGPHDFSKVFVCPGKKQDLVCLNADSGKEKWRIPRIWELDRCDDHGHERITRFGLQGWATDAVDDDFARNEAKASEPKKEIEESKKKVAAARRAFNKKYDAYIAAGPMITNEYLRSRVFLAVARGHKTQYGGGVTDSLIYEISPEDSVEAMTTVPQEVVGWPCKAFDNSVVWACELDSFIRVARDSRYLFDGRKLTCIEWYREIPIWTRTYCASTNARLRAGPDRYAACFSDQGLFRAGPAYLAKNEDHVYRFQINVIDLATGVTHTDLTLAIPFEGDVPRPTCGPWIDSPYHLGISGLQADGTVLRVIMKLGADSVGSEPDPSRTAMEFDLKPLLSAVKSH